MKKIKLTQGKYALVDDSDFEYLNQFNWYARRNRNGTFYAGRAATIGVNQRKNIHMHRLVMSTPEGMETDHIDRNGLNNQKYNLRNVTRGVNMFNKSKYKNSATKYKGVSLLNHKYKLKNGKVKKINPRWQAAISANGKSYYLGYFDSEVKAAVAYNEAALFHHGEYANLNQIPA